MRFSGEVLKERVPILATGLVAILLYLVGGHYFPPFFTLRVVMNLLSDNAFLGVVAVGLTFVILTGGIDLSVGSMVGCASIMVAIAIHKMHMHPLLGMALPLLFGVLFGSVQGLLVSKFKLPPFLVTLAGLFCLRGLALWISSASVQIEDPRFDSIVEWSFSLPAKASLPATSIVFLVIVAIGAFVAKQTRFGRSVYAVGGNSSSAELLGVPVSKTLVAAYALSGFCAALGGVVFTLYTQSGNAISGTGMELDAIACVVIGGTLLSGGYGSVLGTLLGVCILGMVQDAITFQGTLSSWWTKIVIGILLLVFLLMQKGLEKAAVRAVR